MRMRRGAAGLVAAVALLAAPPIQAAQPSTPDVNVIVGVPTAQGVKLTLTAHADGSGASHASLVYRNGDVSLQGLELHRVWVPGLGGHDDHLTTEADDGHVCSDDEGSPIKVRGLSDTAEYGEVQVWIDVRPGENGSEMGRVRFREPKGCGGDHGTGHDAALVPMAAVDDHGDDGGDHSGGQGGNGGQGGWIHDSGWIELHRVIVNVRGGAR